MRETGQQREARVRLYDLMEARLPEILARWESAVRTLHPAHDLSDAALRDYLPQVLENIALAVKTVDEGGEVTLAQFPDSHALSRLDEGFDVEEVAAEFTLLRKTIVDVWRQEAGRLVELEQVARLDEAIDRAIALSVGRFAACRERTLKALDRISAAAPVHGDVDTFLPKLMQVFRETNEAVDAVVVLLREGEHLRVRDAVGVAGERGMFEVRMGEAFAGKIASERRPATLRVADADMQYGEREALVHNDIKVLYGLPMVHDDELVGVAHMGSRTASEFSDADQQLFRVMAERATSLIVQAQLVAREREARREAENALALLDTLLRASPVGMAFVDRDLRYVRINEALATVNGKTVEEHLGRTVREVLPEFADLLEPLLRNVIDKGEPINGMEFAATPPSTPGQLRHWLAYYYPVKSRAGETLGLGGLVFEITDRKRAEMAVQSSEGRLQSILHHAPVAIYIKDAEGRCVLANRRFEDILGFPQRWIIGKSDQELFPEEVADLIRANDKRVLSERRAVHFEEVVTLADGPHTFLSIKFPLPNTAGGPVEVCGISMDITDRKRAEEELKRTAMFREQFLGMVGHDLQNPLNAIRITASYLLRQAREDDQVERQTLRILNASERMARMLQELLDFVRGRLGGGIPVQMESIDMREIARIVVDEHRAAHPERRIDLKIDGETKGRWDPTRVAQVICNLTLNALKHGDPDAPVTVSVTGSDTEVTLEVQNRGIPIADEIRESLFEPFRHGRRLTGNEGLGLGLFIVDQIVRAHGGTIEVRSIYGEGTRVSVRWPRFPAGESPGRDS